MIFYGRKSEYASLQNEFEKEQATLTILYGRRRIGKTRLLKEFCQKKSYFRFEGLEEGNDQVQIRHFLKQLAEQTENELLGKINCDNWHDTLDTLTKQLPRKKKHVLIFDEFPWMIQKKMEFVALFKYFWDNYWSVNNNLMVVFCGSVNSFMVNSLMKSSAFYGRINKEICLGSLSLDESMEFLHRKISHQDILEMYMIFGGIPRYLEEINTRESVIENIQRLCFTKDAYFVGEFNRLFKDEFDSVNVYEKIVVELARSSSLNYSEIMKSLHVDKGGGYLGYLENLELAGFIQSFTPYNKESTKRLVRYRLVDEYLLFYFHFIMPHFKRIQDNQGKDLFLHWLPHVRWSIWSGFAFELFCVKQAHLIQQILNIDQLTKRYGTYFTRKTTKENNFQIDLLFERFDRVITLCEIKYRNKPIGIEVIDEVEKKVQFLSPGKTQTIEPILITLSPPTKKLIDQHYFHRILTADDFFTSGKIRG